MTTPATNARGPVGQALLTVHDLSVVLGGRHLVRGLDLEILPGQRWCMLGPNGAGKTTLLGALAGMRIPDRGVVRIDGQTYDRIGARGAARKRALLLQTRRFAFRMSVRDCVWLGRHPHRGRFDGGHPDDEGRVATALEAMDLTTMTDRDVLELSGGEQQRTHLATILAQAPEIFLLDEPTTHLDLRHQAMLFSHLRTLCEREGRAVVFSTHELAVAHAFATHAMLLCGDGEVHVGPCRALLEPALLSKLFGYPLALVESEAGRAFVPRW